MASDSGNELRLRLRDLGLSDTAITAAWPRWWSEEADTSASARAELRFSVARQLGLEVRSLFDERKSPRFVWREEARFKHLAGEDELQRAGITSFGRAVASILIKVSPGAEASIAGAPAAAIRESLLAPGRPFVELSDLLSLAWAVGIPVIHLRVFPWPQKRMAAMAVDLADRSVVLLGKDSDFPPQIAFYLAHELGHIALGHLGNDEQIVDLEAKTWISHGDDGEERDADAFALELLTGRSEPTVLPAFQGRRSARELAEISLKSSLELGIEPGVIAQLFGHSTEDWELASASLNHIYEAGKPVWNEVNQIARNQINLDEVPADARDFLGVVLGDLPT